MKKIFVSLSLIVTLGLTTVHANDNVDVNYKIKESFKKEFAGATLIKWENDKDFQRATFVLYNHLVIAYFDNDGLLLGSARDVFFYEAPMAVIKTFDKQFVEFNPLEVLEVSNTEGTSYRITIETATRRYRIKVDAGGNILNIIKLKKVRPIDA